MSDADITDYLDLVCHAAHGHCSMLEATKIIKHTPASHRFSVACLHGHLEFVMSTTPASEADRILGITNAYSCGYLQICKVLMHDNLTYTGCYTGIIQALLHNQFDAAKIMLGAIQSGQRLKYDVLLAMCKHRHLQGIRWLYENIEFDADKVKPYIYEAIDDYNIVKYFYEKGYNITLHNSIKKLCKKKTIPELIEYTKICNVTLTYWEVGVMEACKTRKLDMAEWIISTYTGIRPRDIFRIICTLEMWDVVAWLHTKFPYFNHYDSTLHECYRYGLSSRTKKICEIIGITKDDLLNHIEYTNKEHFDDFIHSLDM